MACGRGCDSAPKEDATKKLARRPRGMNLRSFDPKPRSFIENVDEVGLRERTVAVLKNAICRHTSCARRGGSSCAG